MLLQASHVHTTLVYSSELPIVLLSSGRKLGPRSTEVLLMVRDRSSPVSQN